MRLETKAAKSTIKTTVSTPRHVAVFGLVVMMR